MTRLKNNSSIALGVPTLCDVEFVASNLRESDRKDMEGLHPGKPAREIIVGDVEYSAFVYGLYRDGRILALFGVIPLAPGVGTPWLVGTGEVDETPLSFARASHRLLSMLQRSFPVLDTWICSRNSKSVRWHQWCGFEFEKEKVRMGRADYFYARRTVKEFRGGK
ncbi:hypothetical protein [Maridesulfovibrio sp.]|uniref:hypothetical protein n=1 Tax=Maridesulfovibrio sp. TaxID=2795000 RepID=UPI003B0080E2